LTYVFSISSQQKNSSIVLKIRPATWRRLPLKTITADTKVSEIMKMYPELTDRLMDLGLCGCGIDSSLTWTVRRVSHEKGLELDSLLRTLNQEGDG
jgi:hypothetical protein